MPARPRRVAACLIVALLGCVGPLHAGTVSGTVRFDGRPVSGARVTVFQPSLIYFAEDRSDESGAFLFVNVPDGRKQLAVAAPGFEYKENVIDVSGHPWVQTFILQVESETGAWAVIGNTLPELFDATDIAILMADGGIFYCHDTVDPIRFDPSSGAKSFPAGSGVEQGCMNATLLRDGWIVMVGGQSPSDPGAFTNAVRWVKAYNPDADAWSLQPDLMHPPGRWYPGMARLADGSLLVMGGGQAPDASRTETCERLNLTTMTWSATGSLAEPTEFPPSALLHTGDVLATWWPPQLYEPDSGEWRLTGGFNQSDRGWPGHSDHSIVVLEDGRVLAVGIRGADIGNTAMGEIFDPVTETWSLTSNPDLVRFQCEVVGLPDGQILVAGGETEADPPPVAHVLGVVRWCDLYDPATECWRRVPDMSWFREYHAVTLLVPDGRVLTTGGTRIKFQFGPTSADIEAYSPPYLFRGVRPQITAISDEQPPRGAELTLGIFPQTALTSVVLMGSQTTTHWVDGGVPRRLVLPVTQKGSTAVVTLPSDPDLLPLGRYLVFAMVDDIPSVARIVEVAPAPGDVNSDGVIDVQDLVEVIIGWGPCPAPPAACPADVDGDGAVNVSDLVGLILNWS